MMLLSVIFRNITCLVKASIVFVYAYVAEKDIARK